MIKLRGTICLQADFKNILSHLNCPKTFFITRPDDFRGDDVKNAMSMPGKLAHCLLRSLVPTFPINVGQTDNIISATLWSGYDSHRIVCWKIGFGQSPLQPSLNFLFY